jgi:hypothetical protein
MITATATMIITRRQSISINEPGQYESIARHMQTVNIPQEI